MSADNAIDLPLGYRYRNRLAGPNRKKAMPSAGAYVGVRSINGFKTICCSAKII